MHASGVFGRDRLWSLRPYERRLFDAGFQALSEGEREIAEVQLRHFFYIQRLHNDRMNDIYFYFPKRVPRLERPKEFRLARLRLRSGRRRVNVDVETFDGYVRALRFRKPPQPVVAQAFEVEILELGGANDSSFADEIDFGEHEGRHD